MVKTCSNQIWALKFSKTTDERMHHVPYGDDKKVQYIPSVAEIGAGMEDEAIGDDFHYGF